MKTSSRRLIPDFCGTHKHETDCLTETQIIHFLLRQSPPSELNFNNRKS
jgi:hypothetical protein